MLIDINCESLEALQICPSCAKQNILKLDVVPIGSNEETGEFTNYYLPVCSCGNVEVLNMNLPDDEFEYSDKIPDDDWEFRAFLKAFSKFLRGESKELNYTVPAKKPYHE